MSTDFLFCHRLVLLLLLASWSIPVLSQRACYWPDGSPTVSTNNTFIACNAEGVSHCCNEGEACLSNGLCFGADAGLMYRGACTDKTWGEDTAACPLFCTKSPTWANVYMCPNVGTWCGDGEMCVQGDGSNDTVAELHNWSKGTILHLANMSTTASPNSTTSGTAATSSSCLAGVCLSTVKCLPISVPIGVGAGVGFPLILCVIALGVMLKREKRKRGVVLSQHESKESDLRLDPMTYQDSHRDTSFKWNQDEYASERHMLGGHQVHELGTQVYELSPSGRAK